MSFSPLALFSANADTYCAISLMPIISAYLIAICWQLTFDWL